MRYEYRVVCPNGADGDDRWTNHELALRAARDSDREHCWYCGTQGPHVVERREITRWVPAR